MDKEQIDKKQIIEEYIDRQDKTKMGKELNALLAIEAMFSYNKGGKTTEFIKDFSKSLGFKLHLDTAIKIIDYLYPKNKKRWGIYDKMYMEQVKDSAWLKYACKELNKQKEKFLIQ